jgi:hypothetical protein
VLRRLGLPLAICLLMFAHVVSAQTETPTTETFPTFPLVLKCIGTPTLPPKGWTYPGMILMSGYAGIHAMEADWSTPRVVAQFTIDQQGNVPIDGGQVSPDGKWYATPIGEVTSSESLNSYWLVNGLRLYNLVDESKSFTLWLKDYTDIYRFYSNAWSYLPIEWQDNSSLIIGKILLHPFDNRAETARLDLSDSFLAPRVVSPDETRAYGGGTAFLNEFQPGLHDLSIPKTIANVVGLKHISWRRDSAGFMGEMQEDEQAWHGFAYFDRDGKLINYVIQFDAWSYDVGRLLSGRSELQWSPDDRYFVFAINSDSGTRELYIVDTPESKVMDTCLTSLTQPVWSPDGSMFAYLTNAPQNLYLIVVDIKTWKAYVVAQQSGVRGAVDHQLPEMVGWRSTNENQ